MISQISFFEFFLKIVSRQVNHSILIYWVHFTKSSVMTFKLLIHPKCTMCYESAVIEVVKSERNTSELLVVWTTGILWNLFTQFFQLRNCSIKLEANVSVSAMCHRIEKLSCCKSTNFIIHKWLCPCWLLCLLALLDLKANVLDHTFTSLPEYQSA